MDVGEWNRTVSASGAGGTWQELLDGEPVISSPPTAARADCVNRLAARLSEAAAGTTTVAVHTPLVLDERSEPRPDLVLVRGDRPGGGTGALGPADVLLVVEVADTGPKLIYDRGRKASYYARSGVAECWVVDLAARQVLVHTEPASGGYRQIRNVPSTSALTLPAGAAPDGLAQVDVTAILPA